MWSKKEKPEIDVTKLWDEKDNDFFEVINSYLPILKKMSEEGTKMFWISVLEDGKRCSLPLFISAIIRSRESLRNHFKQILSDNEDPTDDEYIDWLVFYYEYYGVKHYEQMQGTWSEI